MRHTGTFLQHDDLPSFLSVDAGPTYTRDELAARTNWDEYSVRLLGYARMKLSRHGAAAARYEFQPPDLVQEAIALWLRGRRVFEAGTERAFFGFLCSVVDSILNHDKEKTVRHGWQYSISKEGGDDATIDEMSEERIRAEGDLERELLFRDNLERFIESLEPDLAAYARYVADFSDSTAIERARVLEMTVTDVRNYDRRLHRHAKQWMKP